MFLIPLVPNPFNQNIQETMQGIAKKVGMTFTIYPNQGSPRSGCRAWTRPSAPRST